MDKALLMEEHRKKFHDNRMRSIGREYYEWRIYKNPIMEGEIFLEIRDGQVVGSSTATPRRVAVFGEVIPAAELGDSFTLPDFRRQGINVKALSHCSEYALSHGMEVIYGAPATPGNYKCLMKVGLLPCVSIGYSYWTKSMKPITFILKTVAKNILGRGSKKRSLYLHYLLKGGIRKPKEAVLDKKHNESNFEVVMIEHFNKNINPLWGKPRFQFFVYRDESYLNWRFFGSPDKFIVLAAQKGDEYLGYMALKMSNDFRDAVICDFVTLDDRADIFLALVRKAEEILKDKGSSTVMVQGIVDSAYREVLGEMGYYDYGAEPHQYVTLYAKTEIGKAMLENLGKWHFTLGDTVEV